MRERWVDRLVRERPWAAYALAVAVCVSLTSSAIALPPEASPNRTMDLVVGVLIVWSGVASLVVPRLARPPDPTTAAFIAAALAFSAEVFGVADRFITGSASVPWLGFAVAVATLAVAAARVRG